MRFFPPIVFLFLFFSTVFSSWASGPIISDIQIDAHYETLKDSVVRSMLPFEVGDSYSPELLEKAKKIFSDSGLFENTDVTRTIQGSKVIVHLLLNEGRLVRKIKISGNYPYLSKKILRLSSLQPGDVYRTELVPEIQNRIREFFEKEGYYGTTMEARVHEDRLRHAVNLHLKITKGKTHRLGEAAFEGNHFFSLSYLQNKLESFFRFKIKRVKKKLNKVQEHYIKKGFVRARVRLTEVTLNEKTNKIDVKVEINERKQLLLHFMGNHWFSSQTLEDHVTFYEERGDDRFAVLRSRDRLIDFYHLNGFWNVQIEEEVKKSGDATDIFLKINEGTRSRLKKIGIHGNKKLGDSQLKKNLHSQEHTLFRQGFYREALLESDRKYLEHFYRNEGFFDAKIINQKIEKNKFGDQVIYAIHVDEGPAYHLQKLVFFGNHYFNGATLLKKSDLHEGRRYHEQKIAKARDKLILLYGREGFAYAKIDIEKKVDAASHQVALIFHVLEGPQAKIGEIYVQGDYQTRLKVILEALKFKTGDRYTYKKILDGQLNLKRLGIFDQVRVIPVGLEEEKENVAIIVRVNESKTLTFDVQTGFDSDKLASGQLLINKKNFFGLGKHVSFRGVGGFELDRGEINFSSPRFFGANWNLLAQSFGQYEDDENFNAVSVGGSVGGLKYFGPDVTLLLKGEVKRFNIFEDQSNQQALAENLFDSTFLELTSSIAYDTRDNFSDPQKGAYALITNEFDTDLANARNNFDIVRLNLSHYQGFFNRFTLSNTFRLGKLFRITNDVQIPATKLFFMGGNDTVRGFEEDAVNRSGGTTSLIYNTELNYRLFDAFKIAAFFDAGGLVEKFSDFNLDTLRDSAGIGLRYVTPVGPIRLDYGFVLDKKPNEKGQRFHFSFGYFF